jgi:hypothetical protein
MGILTAKEASAHGARQATAAVILLQKSTPVRGTCRPSYSIDDSTLPQLVQVFSLYGARFVLADQ